MNNEHGEYVAYRQYYELTHKASVPKPIEVVAEYPDWLRFIVFAMFVSAALLSGVHTIPTVYDGINVGVIITEDIRRAAAIVSFISIELATFVAAYLLKTDRRMAIAIIALAFGVAVVSNIYEVVKAFSSNTEDIGVKIVAVVLGVGAPLIALLAGKMFVTMHSSYLNQLNQAQTDYQNALKTFDEEIRTSYESYKRKNRVKVDHPSPIQIGEGTPRKALPETTSRGARDKVEQYYIDNPENINRPVREVAEILGVSHGLVGKVKKEWANRE